MDFSEKRDKQLLKTMRVQGFLFYSFHELNHGTAEKGCHIKT